MGLYFTTTADMEKAQKDLLWSQSVESNTQLTSSSIASLNQKLMTTSKRPIGAINEVKKEVMAVTTSLNESMDQVSTVLGDVFTADSPDVQKLQEMGANVINAMYQLKLDIEEIEEDIDDLEEAAASGAVDTIIDGGTF